MNNYEREYQEIMKKLDILLELTESRKESTTAKIKQTKNKEANFN